MLYPVFLDLRGKACLVVGGGSVGLRKAEGLLAAGAKVVVVSPEAVEGLARRAASGDLTWHARPFREGDVEGTSLVFAATDRAGVNRAVVEAARERGILANDARGEGGDFHVGATVRRGGLQYAVSTGGASPAYAKLVREHLEDVFGPEHEAFVAWLESLRPRVMARFPDDAARRKEVWSRLVGWGTLALVREGGTKELEELVDRCLSS